MGVNFLALDSSDKLYKIGTGTAKSVLQFVYDFSVNGGAQGTIPLTQISGTLPNNFVIQNALIDVITPLGSSGAATVALTTGQSAGDLVIATLASIAPWSTAGMKVTSILLGTVATLLKTTGTRTPAIVVGVANLNAGKFNLFVEGFLSS